MMLVDDDYPVLEFLSEAIDWESLGMVLQGTYENGATALEAAARAMPDILITDIGMPRMNGLDLIQRLREKKRELRVAILSCHSEFHYAQQALKLYVQDYLLKDTLDPGDLYKLLHQFKESLEQEKILQLKQIQLETMADRSQATIKERFIRETVDQGITDRNQWKLEAETYGIRFDEGIAYLPMVGMIDGYRSIQRRFRSDDRMRFAIDNVMAEVISNDGLKTVTIPYGRRTLLLNPVPINLKATPYDDAIALAQNIQIGFQRSLSISMSFILGDLCQTPEELKGGLTDLLLSSSQHFYMERGGIEKRRCLSFAEDDLFSWYDQANRQFREMLIRKKSNRVDPTVSQWMTLLREKAFPPETVKDWILKLLLDLKLKMQSLQYFRSADHADILHREVVAIDTLAELHDWLVEYFLTVIAVATTILDRSRRVEVWEACRYVNLHLHKRITLEEVANHLYLNASYFSRLFKKETGETFIEYVTRMKINRAKELLDQTSYSVGKICELLGYDNQSYFSKTFKAHVGFTPVEYRE
ncbi:response regulator transcription factor [Desmospora activa]|uniref:response regulator transcription factor n=1 Tax=Desmospora activa TaxID=500615 RepID=UPI001FE576A5|nr:AraC family transcriptional regulator [Desmospora activa]